MPLKEAFANEGMGDPYHTWFPWQLLGTIEIELSPAMLLGTRGGPGQSSAAMTCNKSAF